MNSQRNTSNASASRAVLLFRYFWPFWQFKDASQGNIYAREAAYRHNCAISGCLPTYLLRWSLLCTFALGAIVACDRAQGVIEPYRNLYTALIAGAGLFFTVCFAITCIIAGIYARLRFG
jgi:hypothetical protein